MKKTNKRNVIIIAVLSFILVLGMVAFAKYNNYGPFRESPEKNTPGDTSDHEGHIGDDSDDTSEDTDDTTPDDTEGTTKNPNGEGGDKVPSSSGEDENKSKSVKVEITSAEQDGSTLVVRTLINDLDSRGTCILTLKRSGSNPVTMSSDVQAQPSTSTCRGFKVPTSNLAKGTWKLIIEYTGARTSGATSEEVTIS